ncbi:MAG: putative toxin-antitoxin system toxin component, PIN family [Peptococcaceae bacterium]|nr:putative toxin-antitoxin system toxin component, PIN family [Peptococcaceae bacterium]
MLRAVLDTNVLISGLVFPGGIPDKIIRYAIYGRYKLITSPFILTELDRILRNKFGLPVENVKTMVEVVENSAALIINPKIRLSLIKSKEDDNRILECAVEGKAHYLVTGDRKHIYPLKRVSETKIVLPQEFWDVLQNTK